MLRLPRGPGPRVLMWSKEVSSAFQRRHWILPLASDAVATQTHSDCPGAVADPVAVLVGVVFSFHLGGPWRRGHVRSVDFSG